MTEKNYFYTTKYLITHEGYLISIQPEIYRNLNNLNSQIKENQPPIN